MTASNAANAFAAASQQAVFADRQNEVLTAGRMKPAGSAQQRAQKDLVRTDDQHG